MGRPARSRTRCPVRRCTETRLPRGGRPNPGASRTSAEPQAELAARFPCLTTTAPAAAAHDRRDGGDIHRVGQVATGTHDIQSGSFDRQGWRDPTWRRPSRRPRRRLAPLTRSPITKAAIWRRWPPLHDLGHRLPAPFLGQISPGAQRTQNIGPGVGVGHDVAADARRLRRSRTAAVASSNGEIGRARRRRPGPCRQPGVLGASGEDEYRRAAEDLVLQPSRQTHAARLGLAVQNDQGPRCPGRCGGWWRPLWPDLRRRAPAGRGPGGDPGRFPPPRTSRLLL